MGRGGFEPPTNWLRANCSTAELTPHVLAHAQGIEPHQSDLESNSPPWNIGTYCLVGSVGLEPTMFLCH